MPTLHWIGKEKIINHHLDVPFRTLQHEKTQGQPDSGNRIIHGDNLEALKALLPEYEGRVKCIYIDPPYNTGNEGWAYNDNVTDPRLLRWLHHTVGKEGEDLSRHDKWLCMMYPRLRLLHKLLADDGAIFISIDDNEQAHLRLVMDEIFGAGNFVDSIIWQKTFSPNNSAKYFSASHDFILCYSKNKEKWKLNLLNRGEEQDARYLNPDNDPRGSWTSSDLTARNYYSAGIYSITTPSGREIEGAPKGRFWATSKEKLLELDADNRIWWGAQKDNMPRLKRFISEIKEGLVPQTIWLHGEVGNTQEAKKEFNSILTDLDLKFDTPKPTRLIERVLQISTSSTSIILDSFAGSGTTAHAVLNLNQLDGGNRKFILIEMEDYADSLTAERVRRVINGYAGKPGTGGGFDFYTLGEALFEENGYFSPSASETDIRRYVWHAETRHPWPKAVYGQHRWMLGSHDGTDWWFCYERERAVSLDLALLATLKANRKGTATVAYADYCTLPDDLLKKENIRFKKIPRDVPRS